MSAVRRLVVVLTTLAIVATCADSAHSYVTYGYVWPNGDVVMQLQLGSSSGTLMDGATSWGQSAEWALAAWNPYIDKVQFKVVRDSSASIASSNRVNNVFWSSTVYGKAFGSSTLAMTSYWYTGGRMTEGDITFNTAKSWNSYDGPLRNASGGGRLYDFNRVAMHEFGHVLGLDHPDEHGQSVTAQMNSTISDLDHLAADDVTGAQALYSPAGNGTVTFPPRNESLDFRSQLEAKYRNDLKRGPNSTSVDNEGDVVWTQEYLRYRVNGCGHADAVQRVFLQIDGRGIQPVCR